MAAKEQRRWTGHSGSVNAIAFSPDGQAVISGSSDGTLIIWDANTGVVVRQLDGHAGSINALAVSADDDAVLTGSTDGKLILWDLKTGAAVRNYEAYSSTVTSVAVSSGKLLAASGYGDGTVKLWDLKSEKPIWSTQIDQVPVYGVAISPDGGWVLSTGFVSINKLNIETGHVDNQQLTACNPSFVELNPVGSNAPVECGGTIKDWDIQNWREQRQFLETDAPIGALTESPDGRLGLSASQDGRLRLWDLGKELDFQTFETGMQGLDAIAPSPDGKYLLLGDMSSGDRQPGLWDIAERRIVRTFSGFDGKIAPGAAQISLDGRLVAAAGVSLGANAPLVMLWSMESGNVLCRFDAYKYLGRSVAFSPDSRYLLAGSQTDVTGELMLWDVQTCQMVRRFETNGDVAGIAFSADGRRALTGTAGLGRVVLWDVTTGREISRFAYPGNGILLDVAFGPGERTILGSAIGTVYQWDVDTGKISRQYTGQSGGPWTLDVSADGRYMLSASMGNVVVLWDLVSGEELYHLDAHKQQVYSVAFSPDGKTAFSSSEDGMLVEWRIAEKSLPELLAWIHSNRYVRELTCDERVQYRVEPLCD